MTNKKIPQRTKEIDVILQKCASIEANEYDINTTVEEKKVIRNKQRIMFDKIKEIDYEYYKIICPDEENKPLSDTRTQKI